MTTVRVLPTPKRLLAALLLVLTWVGAGSAWAADATIQMKTDRLSVGESITFWVVVSGATPQGVPQIVTSDGLEVAFEGQARQMTILNGRMENYVKYQYNVSATASGLQTLGPAHVVVDGRGQADTLTAQPIELTVAEGRTDGTTTQELEATSSFDVTEAWQGQLVMYHRAFRSRVSIAQARWLDEPSEGLLVPNHARDENREYVVHEADADVLVQEHWQPLVVTSSGDLTWNAPVLEAAVVVRDDRGGIFRSVFPRTTRKIERAQPLALRVRPLPPPPPGFSGLVGDFQLKQQVDTRNVREGGSVAWSIFLDGSGTLEGYSLPSHEDFEGARIYDSPPRPRVSTRHGRYMGGVTFERTVVPIRQGRLELPDTEVVVFSTSKGAYETLRLPGPNLDVLAGEHQDDVVLVDGPERASQVPEVPQDLGVRPAWTRGPGSQLPWLAWMPAALGLTALPALLLLGLGLVQAVQARVETSRSTIVRDLTPRERLAQLPSAPEERLAALDDALRLALARRLGVLATDLEHEDAEQVLGPERTAEARLVTRLIARTRFANDAPPADLEGRVRALVDALEVA